MKNREFDLDNISACWTKYKYTIPILILVVVALVVYSPISSAMASPYPIFEVSEDSPPEKVFEWNAKQGQRTLHLELVNRFSEARQKGVLSPLEISAPEAIEDHGIQFLVAFKTSVGQAKPRTVDKTSGENLRKADPLASDALEKDLIVARIGNDFTFVLNKFYTITHHALLVTNQFEEQRTRISAPQWRSWYFTLKDTDSVGFFNSGAAAGASQRHKHFQLIPMESIAAYARSVPTATAKSVPQAGGLTPEKAPTVSDNVWAFKGVGNYIDSRLSTGEWIPLDFTQLGEQSTVYRLPQFEFLHGVAVLLTSEEWRQDSERSASHGRDRVHYTGTYGDYLELVYLRVLQQLTLRDPADCAVEWNRQQGTDSQVVDTAVDPCGAYNVVLTKRWMMIVPRTNDDIGIASVNGFSFLGLVLARSEEAMREIRSQGPFSMLRRVTISTHS